MKYSAFILIFAFLFAAAFGGGFPAAASEESEGLTVIRVEVDGNGAISSSTITAKIKTKPGSVFSQQIANDDIKRLYALGYFTDVAIDVGDYKEGVKVTVIVEEKSVIKSIVFEGNKKINTARLKKAIHIKAGDMLDYGKLAEDIREVKALYEKSGFTSINVKYRLETGAAPTETVVKIVVDEKDRTRIKRVSIEGNKIVKTGEIKKVMRTRPAWLFERGYFDEETFEDDLTRIRLYCQDKGFLDIAVTPKFDYDKGKGLMFITLQVSEGKRYLVEDIIIRGNIVLSQEEVRKRISVYREGEPFSYTKARKDVENIRSLYYKKGYMNVAIFMDKVVKPRTQNLDIVFDIDAKEVVSVGKINIKGNTKTKDIVVRRELRAYPGERFDGDQIRRSKERLYNLGFFEDIYFETVPTSTPNVSDLEVTVKESKTGEFSFGGGYSSVD